MKHLLVLAGLFSVAALVAGDCYMHNPRGSNNRLNDQNRNVQNNQRLFDSQNNDAGGYMWGPSMKYYKSSILTIEWTSQHSCGGEGKSECDLIFQYMCDATLRDGDPTQGATSRQTYDETQADDSADNTIRGRHETAKWYTDCQQRQRNKGLWRSDQNLGPTATSTRQDAGGTQHGTECPEERDYWPYWHPNEWKDLAVLSTNLSVCDYWAENTQNVRNYGLCSAPAHNNQAACTAGGGTWTESGKWNLPAPQCLEAPWSRDNHLGNSGSAGSFANWNMTFGPHFNFPEASLANCVLRIRYNISTTADGYDRWTDYNMNGEASPVEQDPLVDVGIGNKLQLALNTDQYGRTFEDRSHKFSVLDLPPNFPAASKLYNLNVRGRRGNIVETYPACEYDFVPSILHMEKNDFIHWQWTGSDYNDPNADGQGTAGTDRSNVCQIQNPNTNFPMDKAKVTLFDKTDPDFDNIVRNFAVSGDGTDAELNDASPYFDGGLIQMKTEGELVYMSTRNNNFSNRSQKGIIKIGPLGFFSTLATIAFVTAAVIVAAGIAALGVVFYARTNPTSAIGQRVAQSKFAGMAGMKNDNGSTSDSVSISRVTQKSNMTRRNSFGSKGSKGNRPTGQ